VLNIGFAPIDARASICSAGRQGVRAQLAFHHAAPRSSPVRRRLR